MYPERPLDLLRWWQEIDRLCKTEVPLVSSRFQPEWLNKPEEFIIATQDGQLAGVVHMEDKRKSAIVHIVVAPLFQRSNLSQMLAEKTLFNVFHLWRKGKCFCDIGKNNRPAQILAGSLGFKREAVYNNRIKYKLSWHDYQRERD